MNYIRIFDEITEIIKKHYAGYERVNHTIVDFYIETLQNIDTTKMTDQFFVDFVNDFLLELDDQHLSFVNMNKNIQPGKKLLLRADQENVYVVRALEGLEIREGDELLEIDGLSVSKIRATRKKYLRSSEAIPERENWSIYAKGSQNILYKNNHGEIKKQHLIHNGNITLEANHLRALNDDTYLLTLHHLQKAADIEPILLEMKQYHSSMKNLIIDVRQNPGGNTSLTADLLPYVFPKNERPSFAMPETLYNCTEFNYETFKKNVDEIHLNDINEDTGNIFAYFLEVFKENRGNGFIDFDLEQFTHSYASSYKPLEKEYIERVIILVDSYTASAAEEFALICHSSSKVTTMGRATAGVNEYHSVMGVTWNDTFELGYSMAKLERPLVSHPLHGKGVQPDHYIPWTKEFLAEDVDMKAALSLLNSLAVK
ncbi:S41 family peptidase [Priestia koreensis]|uniref:S41 family peptidase n=1 Tax=Priestia koreensis TaxID=284581 RepID=UPI00345836CE